MNQLIYKFGTFWTRINMDTVVPWWHLCSECEPAEMIPYKIIEVHYLYKQKKKKIKRTVYTSKEGIILFAAELAEVFHDKIIYYICTKLRGLLTYCQLPAHSNIHLFNVDFMERNRRAFNDRAELFNQAIKSLLF